MVTSRNAKEVLPQILAAFCASVGCIAIGYDEGWASPAIPSLQNDSTINATEEETEWIISGAPIGATIGCLLSFVLTDRLGRRGTVLATSPFYIVAYLLIGFGSNTAMIICGRILAGIINVCTTMASQIYASEISSPSLRGALSSIPTVLMVVGIFLSYIFGSFLDWRQTTLIELSFPIAYLLMWTQHESPVWLLQKGYGDRAKEALEWLRGSGNDVTEEFNRIKDNCDKEALNPKFRWGEVTQQLFYRPLILSVLMMFFQMFGGYGPIVFNSVSILSSAKMTLDSNISAMILAAVMLVVVILATLIVDKVGRKILLFVSGTLMIISLCALGIFFYLKEVKGEDAVATITWLPLASLVLYYAAFAGGYFTVPYILLGETFPVRYRDLMGSIGYFANMIFVFAAVRTFPILKEDIGDYGAYWFYAAVLVLGTGFIMVFIPETKGKTLEEIEAAFGGVQSGESMANLKLSTISINVQS